MSDFNKNLLKTHKNLDSWISFIENITKSVRYYVYEHYLDGELFYIGKGSNDRCFNMRSRLKNWKKYVNGREDEVFVNIVKVFATEYEALRYESKLIREKSGENELVNEVLYKESVEEVVLDEHDPNYFSHSVFCSSDFILNYDFHFDSSIDLDILFVIIGKIQSHKREVKMKCSEIRRLGNFSRLPLKRIKKALSRIEDIGLIKDVDYSSTNRNDLSFTFSNVALESITPNEIFATTVINMDELVRLKGRYAKKLYVYLRVYRTVGISFITKEGLAKYLNPPRTYDEYNFIRKIIEPAIHQNKNFFDGLELNLKEVGRLPDECTFRFKRQKDFDFDTMYNGERMGLEMMGQFRAKQRKREKMEGGGK